MNKISCELVNLLKGNSLKISFAESCTGGLMAKSVTDVSGSSSVMSESYITYSENAKNKILGVPFELIKKHTVVSGEVALTMAQGLFKIAECDIAVSVTGVAGPNSDEYNNPVGLVYLGFCAKDTSFSKKLTLSGSRGEIRHSACAEAFETVKKYIEENY